MPRVEEERVMNGSGRAPGRLGQVLVGFDEVGGAVFDVMTQEMVTREAARRAAAIRGIVHDSSSGGPLVGATVSLADSSRSATTDERGFFALDSVPESGVSILVTHPVLDSLGLGGWTWRVDGSALTRTVSLGVPPLPRLLSRVCRDSPLAADAGVIIGNLGNATRPLADVRVRVSWTVTSVSAAGVQRVRRSVSDTTGANGDFAVCGVPTESDVRVEHAVLGYQPESLPARISETRRWRRMDIRVSR